MPPTPIRPPAPGSASSTQTATTPAAKAASAKHNMSSILSNIDGLFLTARKGALNANSMIYLRKAISDHHRYIILHAIKAGKSNPLLDIPEMLDPSISASGQAPLVSPMNWNIMISSTESEARRALAEGSLQVPRFENPTPAVSTPGTSPASSTMSNTRPPPSVGTKPQMRAISRAGSPAGTASSAPSPSAPTPAAPPPAGGGQSALALMNSLRNLPAGTIMKGDELRKWASMPSADRTEHMRLEPELKRRFEISVQYYRAQSRVKEQSAAAQAAQASQGTAQPTAQGDGQSSANPQAGPSQPSGPPPQVSRPNNSTSNPNPNPPIQNSTPQPLSAPIINNNSNPPPNSNANPNTNHNPNPHHNPNTNTNPNPNNSNIVMGNPSFTLSQPPPPRMNPNQQTIQTPNNPSSSSGPNPGAPGPGPGPSGHTFNQSNGSSNPNSLYPTQHERSMDPSLVPPMPIPPPPPPPPVPVRKIIEEPESERRKRKYRQFTAELGAGLELELGVDEILNDIVEKFISELTRSGVRLAKHRKSDKVEIKDFAFYLDKHYQMTVPGFDAIVPKPTHIPTDTEDRKRLRTVIPRTIRRAEENPVVETNAVTGQSGSGEVG